MIPSYVSPLRGDQESAVPVAEQVAGVNNAYRGLDVHGVSADTRFADVPGFNGTEAVEYEEPQPEPDAIPVRIVNESSNERRLFHTRRAYVTAGADPVRVAGLNPNRSELRIQNLDGFWGIAIGGSAGFAPDTGWIIGANFGNVTLTTQGEVWACFAPGGAPAVGTLVSLIVMEAVTVEL